MGKEIAVRANLTIKYEFILRSDSPEFPCHAECHDGPEAKLSGDRMRNMLTVQNYALGIGLRLRKGALLRTQRSARRVATKQGRPHYGQLPLRPSQFQRSFRLLTNEARAAQPQQ